MKKIHIKVEINSDIDENSFFDTYGEYDEDKTAITYMDNYVAVRVIIDEKITIERKCELYNIKLIFEKGNTSKSIYEIYDPKMTIDLDVQTKVLRREKNGFYVEYKLSVGGEYAGTFKIKYEWEE